MSWAAANVPRRQEGSGNDSPSKSKEQRKRGETVEAVLSRLSKGYSLSMECLGAMHQANIAILKRKEGDTDIIESLQSLTKVATAARDTLERAVLLDPLIVEHAPTLRDAIQKYAERDSHSNARWVLLCKLRPAPPKISSKAHRSTIRQLAYLALTNYADLLMSVCTCECARPSADDAHAPSRKNLLDRGVVKKIKGFANNFSAVGCCWVDDSEEDIQRLALAALCDASALDGSDPVVWLKLACAARAMGHIEALPGRLNNPVLSPFRRLEWHALECGYTALPPNVPPNRAITRLLEDFNSDEIPDSYPPVLAPTPQPCKLNLDLTRYSWSLLGRLLMKVLREGTGADDTASSSVAPKRSVPFGSPTVSLSISPMLLLPSRALTRILSYLENKSIWKFEASCRALSVSIMSIRAALEKRGGNNEDTEEPRRNGNEQDVVMERPEDVDDGDHTADGERKVDDGEGQVCTKTTTESPTKVSRTSKRVRSQQITSDKREERLRKRKAVGFCLRAATLSSAADEAGLKSSLKESIAWDKIKGELWQLPASQENNTAVAVGKGKHTSVEGSRHRFEASERIGASSLSCFLQRLSSQHAGPTDLLLQYVGHVALHVEEVFTVDPGDTMALNTSIMGCFEHILQRKLQDTLIPRFFNNDEQDPSVISSDQALELFAVDVLNVELRFKVCERQQHFYIGFDDDSSYVCCMMPILLEGIAMLDEARMKSKREIEWIKIKARVYWLASGVFLWRSRLTRSVCESIEAEEQGLKYIGSTIDCLSLPTHSPIGRVATPHLESLGRTGAHWKALSSDVLSTYRDEIQASSVVSHAQQQFQERVAEILRRDEESTESPLSEEDTVALSGIGEALLVRYAAPFMDAECKHGELLENFMSVHGGDFLSATWDNVGNPSLTRLVQTIPIKAIDREFCAGMSNPSILSILITCLQVKTENRRHVAELLVRLVLTALDRYEQLCRAGSAAKSAAESPDNFSDSEDGNSVGGGGDNDDSDPMGPRSSAMKYGRLIKFILDKVHDVVASFPVDADKLVVASSDEFQRVIHHSLAFSSSWINHFTQQPSVLEESLDQKMFKSIRRLVYSIWQDDTEGTTFLKELFLFGLVRITESQRVSFDSLVRVQGTIRARRAVRQRVSILRAEFIGSVFCEIGNLLSKNLFIVEAGKITRSQIMESDVALAPKDGATNATTTAILAILCESLLWFCEYTGIVSNDEDESTMSSFDRPIVDRLLVPVACAIVSLCGSGSCTRPTLANPKSMGPVGESSIGEDKTADRLCLAEFLDSDASAHEFSDNEDSEEGSSKKKHTEMLRVLCHIVHCVGIVFEKADEKEIISFESSDFYTTTNGPLLPLIVTRVLNHVADTLLREFEDNQTQSDEQGVWARNYPFGTGGIGALLDSALYKAYKCLHAFTLSGANDQYPTKEHVSNTTGDIDTTRYSPESHSAAAQLYRCIVRAGKKTPPKAALETVSSALPPLRESDKSRMIRDFLFSSDTQLLFELGDIISIVTKASNWERKFDMVLEWEQAEKTRTEADKGNEILPDSIEDEVFFIRKGIFVQLAQGDLPTFSSDGGGKDDDRANTIRFEEQMSKKFNAILNTLCFAETYSIRGWFRAAQCLLGLQEVIADRLGLSKGFSRSKDFHIPDERPPVVPRLSIASLREKQEQESQVRELGWIQFLGDDLSLYVKHRWSSFQALQMLSDKLLKTEPPSANMRIGDDSDDFKHQVRKEIGDMQRKSRFADWQQAWGGMFVSALNKMAIRCMCVAVFIFHERSSAIKKEDENLLPEILECLGTEFYSNMMGSQSYGYPMHVMALHRKRLLANAARVCFQSAVDVALSNSKDGKAETYDLLFMIGKCHEKIAGTLKLESYSVLDLKSEANTARRFEFQMKQALNSYRAALDEADNEHGEAGGSSHGSTEVFYRLHASRLKCLILAGGATEDERSAAEEEALRLSEMHWYSPPSNTESLAGTPVRDRVWNVLADIVSALTKCRLEHSFFHRSVYRHAQALMWAPVLCDPLTGRLEGSKSTVPATKSCHLRGLNHATNAAKSALAVMSTLFEKKRTQLCAVWVTTSYPPTAFETLNNSIRKYDSLRGKYISAYIECLRLCGNRNELETLLRWVSTSKRDLPSVFCASAMSGGGRPEKSHTHDSLLLKSRSFSSFYLLTGLKRKANSAMASVLKDELVSKDSNVRSPENHLKLAYACFLRLNCTIKDMKKTRAWKYELGGVCEAEALTQAFLQLGETNTVAADPNDWSGGGQKAAMLEAAVQKCKELFPSLSGAFYSKKAIQKSKNQGDPEGKEGSERDKPQMSGKKRSFEVEVPDGLGEGETFTTTIKAGENSAKKVKLTVPAGKPRMLRFSVDLSTQSYD